MGSLWRSADMQLVQLFVQIDAAHDTVDELGELGLVQFIDLNPDVNAFQRNFVNEVKRSDELERKVRYFESQVEKARKEDEALGQVSVNYGLGSVAQDQVMSMRMEELESQFEDLEKELKEMSSNQEMLDRNYNELVELQYILESVTYFFAEDQLMHSNFASGASFDGDEEGGMAWGGSSATLGFVTGVLERERMMAFERVLFRATRGNMFLRTAEIDDLIKDPSSGEYKEKNVFIVFFQGTRLQAKIKKICESFGANVYPCPDTPHDRMELQNQVAGRLEDLKLVLARTREHSSRTIERVSQNLETWKMRVLKEKSIYHTMNLFNYDVGRKCLIAEGWCPMDAIEDIQLAMRKATERSGAQVPSIINVIRSKKTPPTYFKTNKFTENFQGIVDSYGMARYKEVNPTPFTIITFPFLFAVMYGDIGHGIMMLLMAVFMIAQEKKLAQGGSEMLGTFFGGRYLILLMSIFAIYTGSLYNEVYSIPIELPFYPSKWTDTDQSCPGFKQAKESGLYCYTATGSAGYLYGVDPVWADAENPLDYYNSLKMKLSVIFGVTQMLLGIFLSLLNHLHFGDMLDVFFGFIPQFIFLSFTFGYMCILIVFKWCYNWDAWAAAGDNCCHGDDCNGLTCWDPPMLLNVMIYFFLSPGSVKMDLQLFSFQPLLQGVLLGVAVIMIPIMLLAKPLILWRRNKAKQAKHGDYEQLGMEEESDDGEEEEFEFGEVMVHQMIHTVEFVLGCVSNTASYLRLWALSLAHSELSQVFYNMVMIKCFNISSLVGIVACFIGFSVWAVLTVGVLLGMESLSAFLHALRLHWVEFQNKFYYGDGYAFEPFAFKRIMEEEAESG